MSNDSGQGPIEKAKDKVEEKVEPTEQEWHGQVGGPDNASGPFAAGDRSDEQDGG